MLIDSCLWSLVFRRRRNSLLSGEEQRLVIEVSRAIREGRAVISGPIRQEILSGIRESAQFEKLRMTMRAFPDEAVLSTDYEEASRLFNFCRSHGVQSSPIYLLLCAVARGRTWAILTNEDELQRCMELINR